MPDSDLVPVNQEQQQLQLLLQQDANQFEIAKKMIDANLEAQRASLNHIKIIVLLVIATTLIIGVYALHLGKDQFLSDVLKVLIGAFGGGGLGYAIGRRRQQL